MHILSYTLRIFCFNDEDRGKIAFEGNLLFTHFGEIGTPKTVAPNKGPAKDAPPAPNDIPLEERSIKDESAV